MGDESGPSKTDLQTAMRKLRSLPANKSCFDCDSRNPSWATVTYGVFICIDCAATHRQLGVHLTFVRSTNLDTNWTWLQLRAMQLGGNANATQFFKQHGCNTTDAQIKYKSRAAQLYRDKLAALCQEAQKKYGNQLLIDTIAHHESQDQEDVDFFSQEFNNVHVSHSNVSLSSDAYISKGKGVEEKVDDAAGPRVDHLDSVPHETEPPPSVILKKPLKKPVAGAKKGGGLGAQKVKVNFSELEQRAAEMEKEAEAAAAPINLNMEEPKKDSSGGGAAAGLSARLAMQDLEKQRKNIEAKVAGDANKAAAAERLGMGGISRGRVAHSVALGARTIAQADASGREARRAAELEREKREEEWEVVDAGKWGGSSKTSSNNGFDDDMWGTSTPASKNDFDFEKPAPKPYSAPIAEKPARSRALGGSTHAVAPEVDVQKKFGNAKAISSDQYFGTNEMDYETKAALSRFEGQTSLGSADLWGNGSQQQQSSSYASQVPEMSEIKDSLRAGASKVAEKFSSISSSLSSYMS